MSASARSSRSGASPQSALDATARQWLEGSVLATAIWGPDGRISYVNPAFVALWHLPDASAALWRRGDGDLWLPEPGSPDATQGLTQHDTWQGELQARCADGRRRPVTCLAQRLPGSESQQPGCMATFVGRSAKAAERQAPAADEDLVDAVIGAAGVLVLVTDPQGRIVRFNSACERISGCGAEAMIGRMAGDALLPPAVSSAVRHGGPDSLPAGMQPGEVHRCTAPWQAHDGTHHLIEWSSSVVLGAGSGKCFIVSVGVDVTGREAAAAALARSERQLRQAQAVADIGASEIDPPSGRIERADHVRPPMEPDVAPGVVSSAFGTDIAAARHAQLQLNAVVERTGIGVWEWNARTGKVQVNDQVAALLGVQPAEVPSQAHIIADEYVHPEDRAARRSRVLRMLRGEADGFECEIRVRHRLGHWLWLMERGRVVSHTDAGEPLLVIGTTQEITKLKQHEQALKGLNSELEMRVAQRTQELSEAKAAAERASAAKSEFLSRMSHELRTPMNAIIGFGRLLELAPLPPQERDSVLEIVRAGHHLLDLVDEVLDLATVESGRIHLVKQPVETAPLVEACVALMRPAAQQGHLILDCHIDGPCPPVLADKGRLKQVLLNLLSNAIKYNARGGLVAVSCGTDAQGDCVIRVIDSGPGLTPAQRTQLFQPFERLHAAGSAVQGTGIGLSVSKRLMELMGGEIGVESEPGQGCIFWLRLPAADTGMAGDDGGSAVTPLRPRAAAPTGPAQMAIYIEDNAANQRLMQRIVARRRDLALVCSADALEAVPLALRVRPGLVLLDIQLPHLDGYQVLERLRAADIKVPVVAISANAMQADVERGLAAGFADYLTKPLDVQRVLDMLDAQLPARELQRLA